MSLLRNRSPQSSRRLKTMKFDLFRVIHLTLLTLHSSGARDFTRSLRLFHLERKIRNIFVHSRTHRNKTSDSDSLLSLCRAVHQWHVRALSRNGEKSKEHVGRSGVVEGHGKKTYTRTRVIERRPAIYIAIVVVIIVRRCTR